MKKSAEHLELGKYGERAARRYLRRNGYRIIDKNVVMHRGEIDIIAKKDDRIVFVEVKTRRAAPYIKVYRPAMAVGREKRMHLISACNEYCRKNKVTLFPRGDIIEVIVEAEGGFLSRGKYEINHIIGAFGGRDLERPLN